MDQVGQALAFLGMVARNVFDPDSAYARVLRDATDRLSHEDPTYVFHEYLEDANLPVSFEDFAHDASEAGLRFVGDADLHDPSSALTDEARTTLTGVADDVVRPRSRSVPRRIPPDPRVPRPRVACCPPCTNRIR